MQHRIAVAGNSPSLMQSARKALGDHAEALVAIKPGEALEPTVTAVIGLAKDASHMVDVALALGARHEALLTLIAQAIDAREGIPMTNADHIRTVSAHFAMAAGLNQDDKTTLIRGALLHDLGKLQVPNDVLLTKAMLTHDEWETLRRHTVFGAEMAGACEGLQDIAPILRSHHECFDGTGYPDGLEGEDIPYLARMMKLIDVYCAMTAPRHYRTGKASPEEAIAHFEEESGKHFDPALARIFIEAVTPAEEYPSEPA